LPDRVPSQFLLCRNEVKTRFEHRNREFEHCALRENVVHLLRRGDGPTLRLIMAGESQIGLPLLVLSQFGHLWCYDKSMPLDSIWSGNISLASARSSRLISPILFVMSSQRLSLSAMVQDFVRVVVGEGDSGAHHITSYTTNASVGPSSLCVRATLLHLTITSTDSRSV
jgi:hypothetical protein